MTVEQKTVDEIYEDTWHDTKQELRVHKKKIHQEEPREAENGWEDILSKISNEKMKKSVGNYIKSYSTEQGYKRRLNLVAMDISDNEDIAYMIQALDEAGLTEKLKDLDLSSNKLTTITSDIEKLTKLEQLSLTDNQLTDVDIQR